MIDFTDRNTNTLRMVRKEFLSRARYNLLSVDSPYGCRHAAHRDRIIQFLRHCEHNHSSLLQEAFHAVTGEIIGSHQTVNLTVSARKLSRSQGLHNERTALFLLAYFGITTEPILGQALNRHRSTVTNLVRRLSDPVSRAGKPSKKQYLRKLCNGALALTQDGKSAVCDLLKVEPAEVPSQVEHILGVQRCLIHVLDELGVPSFLCDDVRITRPGYRKDGQICPDCIIQHGNRMHLLEFDRTSKATDRFAAKMQRVCEFLDNHPSTQVFWFAEPKPYRALRRLLDNDSGIAIVTDPEGANFWTPPLDSCERWILAPSLKNRLHMRESQFNLKKSMPVQ